MPQGTDVAIRRDRAVAEVFSITRVNRLRRAAERAREIPYEEDSWALEYQPIVSNYAYDLLRVFNTLWLKPGFELHASVYWSGGNGNGEIWAEPTDTRSVASGEDSELEDKWKDRSPRVVPLMEAIEGDGSPWSYLSASILSREAEEFGAVWHGCEWSDQKILSKAPRQADDRDSADRRERTGEAPVRNWSWCGTVPRTWKPTYVDTGTNKEVILHIYNPIGQDRIYRATDTYPAGSYDCKTEDTELCWGDGGMVY